MKMDREILRRLELLNQLRLTEEEKESVLSFFEERSADLETLESIDTAEVERMVHVMPVLTVVREDVVDQKFEREDLQVGAPETDEGYWCVPKVVE
jgi:aspartyl-tRNA(Asn)/glutamyl-tRNA(Gln) amidotransferase subunit C